MIHDDDDDTLISSGTSIELETSKRIDANFHQASKERELF